GLRRPGIRHQRDSQTHGGSGRVRDERRLEPVSARIAVRPATQLQLTARLLDEGRAGLDPVAGVAVDRAVDAAQVRAMNVPADDAVVAFGARMLHGELLETPDVAHARADRELQPLCERMIRPA